MQRPERLGIIARLNRLQGHFDGVMTGSAVLHEILSERPRWPAGRPKAVELIFIKAQVAALHHGGMGKARRIAAKR
jgi:hypothetical protein